MLEGDPGIGKSAIAVKHLQAKGFVNGDENPSSLGNKYYVITPTSFEEAKAKLQKAFNEGAVVVIDELNTMNLEKILNPMLSGVGLNGKRANTPGFMVLATQNPISFKGRNKLSNALLKRFVKMDLKSYKPAELEEIVAKTQNVDIKESEGIVARYIDAVSYAGQKSLTSPTPRNFFKGLSAEVVKKHKDYKTKNKGFTSRS